MGVVAVRVTVFVCLALASFLGLSGSDRAGGQMVLPTIEVTVGDHQLIAEVPITHKERYGGLSGRKRLEPGRAMLFYYRKPKRTHMHMTDMHFPLDFIWCLQGKVLGVSENIPPAPYAPRRISPPQPCTLALEVPAGWARGHQVTAGTPVRMRPRTDSIRQGDLAHLWELPGYQVKPKN